MIRTNPDPIPISQATKMELRVSACSSLGECSTRVLTTAGQTGAQPNPKRIAPSSRITPDLLHKKVLSPSSAQGRLNSRVLRAPRKSTSQPANGLARVSAPYMAEMMAPLRKTVIRKRWVA